MKTVMVYISFLLIGINSCNTTEPPPPPPPDDKPTLTLELDDAQCTEAWILFKSTKLQLPSSITLKQFNPDGDSISTTINLITPDTLLYIDSLFPNQTYFFHSIIQPSNHTGEVKSNVLSVTTMDTTSHNFVWQMFTFGGETGSSVLNDVVIINENDIWAVGEIWIKDDTSSLGYTKYNAVHWDGSEWELKRLQYNNSTISPIRGILIINPNDIYLAAGSVFHWDGISSSVQLVYSRLNLPDPFGTIEKLWGQSATAIYGVGNAGSLIFYNGQNWSRIESGTELNINDIWGDYNEKTQEWEILAVASNILHSFEKEVIKIDGINAELVNKVGIDWTLSGVWFKPNRKYYAVGSGIYQKYNLTDAVWKDDSLDRITNYHVNKIRANDINDVFVVGAFGEVLHFNGVRWKSYLSELGVMSGSYLSVNIKNNLFVATGYEATQAKIMIGRRTQ